MRDSNSICPPPPPCFIPDYNEEVGYDGRVRKGSRCGRDTKVIGRSNNNLYNRSSADKYNSFYLLFSPKTRSVVLLNIVTSNTRGWIIRSVETFSSTTKVPTIRRPYVQWYYYYSNQKYFQPNDPWPAIGNAIEHNRFNSLNRWILCESQNP